MPRVLLLATTTGYQTRAFGDAAERLGATLVFATDRCEVLDDPWRDDALPIRFHDVDGALATIVEAHRQCPIDGVLAVGDRPTIVAARAREALGLPGHSAAAAAAARNKRLTRERLREAGLPVPRFAEGPLSADPRSLASRVGFPAVVKPLALSGSRGVMRVDDEDALAAAVSRLRMLLAEADVRAEREASHDRVMVESFIEGHEYAVEGVMNHGALDVLAVFDKPDPLDGPFFEETIYVTPSRLPAGTERAVVDAVTRAAAALDLSHGPVHAECRVNGEGVFVLEVAARPIGGLCARALRFLRRRVEDPWPTCSFEELLLRHALGEASTDWCREAEASGVMMIPIPGRGVFRGVHGMVPARAVTGVEDIRITAKVDQVLVPLPEGSSYLGFIFARGALPADVERALREAQAHLAFAITPEMPMLQLKNG